MALANALRRGAQRALAARPPEEEYAGFVQPDDLMRKIDLGWATVAGILCGTTVLGDAAAPVSRYAERMRDVGLAAEDARQSSEVDHRIDMDDTAATMQISFPRIRCDVVGLPPQPSSEQSGAHERSRAVLRNLLPGLDLGRIGEDGGARQTQFELRDAASRDIPLEALGAINVEGVPKLDLADWHAPLRGAVQYRIVPTSIRTVEPTDRITDHTSITISVSVLARIRLPRQYCEWAQHATGADDYVPLATWLHFQAQRDWSTGKFSMPQGDDEDAKAPVAPPARIPHPDATQRQSTRAQQQFGVAGRKMTDNNDVCVLPTGRVIYAPTVPGASVSGIMRECVRDGEVDLKVIHNRHVFTDWVLHKMGMSDAEGTLHLVDLTGARPPSPQVIAHLANYRINSDRLDGIFSLARRLGVDLGSGNGALIASAEDLTWSNLLDVPVHADDTNPRLVAKNEQFFELGRRLGELYTKLELSQVPLWEQYEIRPWLALFGPYLQGRPEAVRLLGDQLAHNRSSVDPQSTPEFSNMPGVEGVMPHQRRVCGTLATDPEGAILDVRAGGGKSLASIFDITHLMAVGKVHRPVVIMPSNLLANFSNEVVKFSAGRLRPFLINNRVWRGLIRRIGSNPVQLLELLKSQPANTVFLVDYGWLMHGVQRVGLGDESADFFPHAALLLEIGPDYCCLDESHKAKKIATGRSLAASVITGAARYRRIMSGTLLHNTAADLVGQMAQIEPTALGDLGDEIRENRRVSVADLPMLDAAKANFARTISVPRKEWAHLLPPLIERVHVCEMTPRQQKFYNHIYERLQQQILDDPKLKKLLAKAKAEGDQMSEALEARMSSVLKRKFVPLEQWLNAPDSEFSEKQFGQIFGRLEGVTAEDLMTPKITVLDGLLRQHLEGGHTAMDDGEEQYVAPSKNKAIIFCYNKAVTEHVFAHSRYAKMGVKYQQGDDSAIERFKHDPEVLFLYASVTSMAEGHNLQMADRVVSMQSYWTPGLGEQALARVWRPDVPDATGTVKYPREHIWYDQILIAPSIEVAKMARLISKQVTNLLVEEHDSSLSLRRIVRDEAATFDKMRPVKMSLDTLKKFATARVDASANNPLSPYFRAYALTKSWERREFKEARERVRAEIEARVGHKVTNSDLSRLSMTPPTNRNTPEFDVSDSLQAHGFVPWTEGFTGFNPTGLHLVPLSMPKPQDDDEEDGDESDADEETGGDDDESIVVERDDPVWTELGPGRIVSARRGTRFVNVRVEGFRDEPVRLWRYAVLAANNPIDKRALDLIVRRAGTKGLPTLSLGNNGELVPQRNALPAANIIATQREAERAIAENAPAVPAAVPGAGRAPAPTTVPGQVATRADLTRDRGRITIGNHEAVLLRHAKTGVPAWIVRHVQNPKDRSQPYPTAQKRDAVDELLRRHNDAMAMPVAGRSRGVPASDPNLAPPQRTVPRVPGSVPGRPTTMPDPKTPGTARGGKTSATRPPASTVRTLSLTDIDSHEEQRDVRRASAGLFSGTVCLVTTDGGDRDTTLAESGFDRIARRLEIQIKNPRAYRTLVQLLIAKFDIPDANKRALLQFADQYQAARAQVAYLKAKELPQHALWLRQQRTKARTDTTIMPWPLVRNGGRVSIVINEEQLKTKAVAMLKRLTYPPGTARPVRQPAQMIAMLRSVTGARQLMTQLKRRGVDFENQDELLEQLKKIRG